MFLDNHAKVMFYRESIDMRKSIDGLCTIVVAGIKEDLQSGNIFVFLNKKLDKIKILVWDRNGFCLLYKRLEKTKFKKPKFQDNILSITSTELRWLLDALDIDKLGLSKSEKYSKIY